MENRVSGLSEPHKPQTHDICAGSVRLQRSAWKEGGISISSGRRVTLTRKGAERFSTAIALFAVHSICVSKGCIV